MIVGGWSVLREKPDISIAGVAGYGCGNIEKQDNEVTQRARSAPLQCWVSLVFNFKER